MDTTLLIGLSHQLASYRSMDVIANNIANASTPAFKRESVKFEEVLSQVQPAEGETGLQTVSFVQDKGVVRDINAGRIETTRAPFDFAVNGTGYFVVNTPQGERYTRNGHFTLDGSGKLVTDDGYPVLGEGGDITITADDGDVHVAQDGTLSGNQGQLGKLRLVKFDNERALKKEGSSLYATDQSAQSATEATINQGMLESSNVEPVVEISHMLEVMRAYQATANLTQSQEDLMRQAIDKLGSVSG